jgi:hypothetical protein
VANNDLQTGGGTDRTVGNTIEPLTSPEVAKVVLARSQSDYQRAVAYLAASDTSGQQISMTFSVDGGNGKQGVVMMYQQRLVALNMVMSATEEALKDAPHDPLLHQYYQSTAGAREATEQRLADAGIGISHY